MYGHLDKDGHRLARSPDSMTLLEVRLSHPCPLGLPEVLAVACMI